MMKNTYFFGNELSLSELSTVAAGKDGEMFAGEYGNSGKQVGAMTSQELDNFYRQRGITECSVVGEEAWLHADDFFLTKVHVVLHLAKG